MKKKTAQPKESAATKAARALAQARWAKTGPQKRKQFGQWVRAHRKAIWRSNKPRCPCGAMTAKRAAARAHKCVAPETAQA